MRKPYFLPLNMSKPIFHSDYTDLLRNVNSSEISLIGLYTADLSNSLKSSLHIRKHSVKYGGI